MRKVMFLAVFFLLQSQSVYSADYYVSWWNIVTSIKADKWMKSFLDFEVRDNDDYNRTPAEDVVKTIVLTLPDATQLNLPSELNGEISSRIQGIDNNSNGQIDLDLGELSTKCSITMEYNPEITPSPHPAGDYTLHVTFIDDTIFEETKTFNGGMDATGFPVPSNLDAVMDSQTGEITLTWDNPDPNVWDGEVQVRVEAFMDTGALYHSDWRYTKLPIDTDSWILTSRFTDFANNWGQKKIEIEIRAYSDDEETKSRSSYKYYELDGHNMSEITNLTEQIIGDWNVTRSVTVENPGSLTIGQ